MDKINSFKPFKEDIGIIDVQVEAGRKDITLDVTYRSPEYASQLVRYLCENGYPNAHLICPKREITAELVKHFGEELKQEFPDGLPCGRYIKIDH